MNDSEEEDEDILELKRQIDVKEKELEGLRLTLAEKQAAAQRLRDLQNQVKVFGILQLFLFWALSLSLN